MQLVKVTNKKVDNPSHLFARRGSPGYQVQNVKFLCYLFSSRALLYLQVGFNLFKTYRLYTYSYLKHIVVGWLSHSVVELVKVVATSRMEMMMAQENPVLPRWSFWVFWWFRIMRITPRTPTPPLCSQSRALRMEVGDAE